MYRGIPSRSLYLIVAQDRRDITVHYRDDSGTWLTRQARAKDSIRVSCLGDIELTLEAIYQDVVAPYGAPIFHG